MMRSQRINSATLLLQVAYGASFLVQSNVSFVPWGVQPSMKSISYGTATHADIIAVLSLSLSSSSDPQPSEAPPPRSVLRKAVYFASPENTSRVELDDGISTQQSASFPIYSRGDTSRLDVNKEFLERGNKALEHVIVSCYRLFASAWRPSRRCFPTPSGKQPTFVSPLLSMLHSSFLLE
jgi:hypothetical protein